MTESTLNIEGLNASKFPTLEGFKAQFEQLESSGADLYETLDPSQQDYLQDLAKSPEWEGLDVKGKLESLTDAITKFFRGTELGHYLQHHGPHLAHLAVHSLKHIKI